MKTTQITALRRIIWICLGSGVLLGVVAIYFFQSLSHRSFGIDNTGAIYDTTSPSQETLALTLGGGACLLSILMLAVGLVSVLTLNSRSKSLLSSASETIPYEKSNVNVVPGNVTSIEAELQKAADMLKNGLIDEEEYKELKKKIISKS